MSTSSPKFHKSAELISAICGGLLMSVSVIPQAVLAQQPNLQQPTNLTNSKVNPCPKIFYEEPYNNRVAVPQSCPPNAYSQRITEQGITPQSNVPATPTDEQTQLSVGGETGSLLNPKPSIVNEAPDNGSQGATQPSTTPSSQTPRTTPASPIQTPLTGQVPSATIAVVNGKVNVKLVNETGANVTYQVIGDTAPRSLQGKTEVILQTLDAPVTVTFQREDKGLLQVTPQPATESGILEVRLKETTDISQDRSALRIEGNGSVFLN